jgi:hypothetical protein
VLNISHNDITAYICVAGHLWYVPADLLTPLFDLPNKQPALQALDSGRDFVSIGLPIHLGFVMPLL